MSESSLVYLYPEERKIDIDDRDGRVEIFQAKTSDISCIYCESEDMAIVDDLYKLVPNDKKCKDVMPVMARICCNCGHLSLFSTAVLTNYVNLKG